MAPGTNRVREEMTVPPVLGKEDFDKRNRSLRADRPIES